MIHETSQFYSVKRDVNVFIFFNDDPSLTMVNAIVNNFFFQKR